MRVRGLDQTLYRQHRAERVGHVCECHQARARPEQLHELLELELPAPVDRCDLERATGLGAQHLPGDDVGVMLERADQDLVPGAKALAAVGLRDEVDALGRTTDEYDLARRAGVDEAPYALACTLVGRGGCLAERMHAAVHVRMRMRLVLLDCPQHR